MAATTQHTEAPQHSERQQAPEAHVAEPANPLANAAFVQHGEGPLTRAIMLQAMIVGTTAPSRTLEAGSAKEKQPGADSNPGGIVLDPSIYRPENPFVDPKMALERLSPQESKALEFTAGFNEWLRADEDRAAFVGRLQRDLLREEIHPEGDLFPTDRPDPYRVYQGTLARLRSEYVAERQADPDNGQATTLTTDADRASGIVLDPYIYRPENPFADLGKELEALSPQELKGIEFTSGFNEWLKADDKRAAHIGTLQMDLLREELQQQNLHSLLSEKPSPYRDYQATLDMHRREYVQASMENTSALASDVRNTIQPIIDVLKEHNADADMIQEWENRLQAVQDSWNEIANAHRDMMADALSALEAGDIYARHLYDIEQANVAIDKRLEHLHADSMKHLIDHSVEKVLPATISSAESFVQGIQGNIARSERGITSFWSNPVASLTGLNETIRKDIENDRTLLASAEKRVVAYRTALEEMTALRKEMSSSPMNSTQTERRYVEIMRSISDLPPIESEQEWRAEYHNTFNAVRRMEQC